MQFRFINFNYTNIRLDWIGLGKLQAENRSF